MKQSFTVAVVVLWSLTVAAQEKPRLYVAGTGTTDVRTRSSGGAVGGWDSSWNSNGGNGTASGTGWAVAHGSSHSAVSAHDETVELMKTFEQRCPEVALTVNGDAAEYAIRGNHESNMKGLLHKRDQIAVVKYTGDVVYAGNTRSVGSAVQEACKAVLADWKQHPVRRPELVRASETTSAAPAVVAPPSAPTALHNVPGGSVQGFSLAPAPQPAPATGETQNEPSLGDVARRNRQVQQSDVPGSSPKVMTTHEQIQQLLILNKFQTDKDFAEFVETSAMAWVNADPTRIARWNAGGDSRIIVVNEAFIHVMRNVNAARQTQ